ncbi:MAG: 6-carboxytetrahydropterin synthase QueD [Candidatus Omnitrophica bacterium]|jgi:6-pyruvoyltetrahydropterin/6-carboxytetrahydropterin synthase|nr:6-carboxytetrahydropterin synthase QueD [Candidatus Omnitrophota bacterium]MDD5574490.1 6-carboxytetrahydropterin synthase QueD [Candidatus Omnitrophota bacterium]
MFEVSVSMSFSAAHNLREYRGKCEELHGHNWKVEAAFRRRGLDKTGMVADFVVLKKTLKDVLDELDHKYLNAIGDFKKANPTSEHIARWVFERLKKKFSGKGIRVSYVKVWETDQNCAVYTE